MTSTGCCGVGVKKQKLLNGFQNNHHHHHHQNGYNSTACNNHESTTATNNHSSVLCPSLSCLSAHSVVAPSANGSVKHCAPGSRHNRSGGGDVDEEDELMDHSQGANAPPSPNCPRQAQNGTVAAFGGARGRRNRVVCNDMVVFCFDVLSSFLKGQDLPKAPKFSNEQFPLFVTWKLGKDKKLRGCIGTFNCTGLHNGLREYAITSACKDSRFEPITNDEVSKLHCSVSLLMDFEMAAHYLDWEIGTHGIRIEFSTEKGSKKAATYLPEVAVEQGWNHMQTIDSLLRKGGFKGQISPDIRASVCVIRFQSDKLTISHQEYLMHKRTTCGLSMNTDGPGPSSSTTSGQMSNGYAATNGYVGGSATASSSGGGGKTKSRLFPSIGGGGGHRYQTRSTDTRRSPSAGRRGAAGSPSNWRKSNGCF